MRKDKIIYDVKEAVRAYSKDAKITESYVLHLVNVTRAEYIRQTQRKNPGEDKVSYTQTLFLELEVVDRSYLPSLPTDTTILRTVKVIPKIVGKEVLKNMDIRSIDRISQEIEFMDKSRAIYGAAPNFIFAFLDDDFRIYFIKQEDNTHKLMENVAVTVILEEPDAITDINELDTQLVEYPMPASLWSRMKPDILQQVYKTMGIEVDTVDDNQTIQ